MRQDFFEHPHATIFPGEAKSDICQPSRPRSPRFIRSRTFAMAPNAGVLGHEASVRHRDVKREKREHSAEHSSTEAVVADELLAVLGYKPELSRNRSTWQVSFMSFVLASVPYGLSLTLYYPVIGGGPVAIIWGWLLVGLIMTCVAISLGEITSAFPTAGGVYYQTFMVCPPWCRTVTAWICGWAYTMGVVSITLSVNFGTAQFFVACINIFTDAEGNPIWAAETYQVFLLFLAITFLCNAVSSLANRWLPILDVCIFCTMSTTLHEKLMRFADLCDLLDLCRSHGHCHLHSCASQGWTKQCRLCFHRI